MHFVDIQGLLIDVWQVGYMEAMRAYEPVRDEIRKADIAGWLKIIKVDRRVFRNLENAGLIKARKLGKGRNSPLIYSKTEIKKALATRTASRMYVSDGTCREER